jgi:hypothetical protein
MPSRLNRCLFLASTALSLSLITYSAQATPSPLPGLTNLDFTQQNAGGTAPKSTFTSFNPTGWYGGGTGYISIDAPIAGEDAASNGAGGTLTAYADPVGKVPGNYVQADGNPVYEDGINYQLSGLTAGTKYLLSFYQGASQQTGFTGTTTNQWIVTLGTTGSTLYAASSTSPGTPKSNCGTSCVYEDTDTSAKITHSPLMTVLTGAAVGWNFVQLTVTADATNDVLSFLAWGDNGNTTNLPPLAFLSGVQSGPGLGAPEPASLALFGVGLAGLGAVARRRRAKKSTSA